MSHTKNSNGHGSYVGQDSLRGRRWLIVYFKERLARAFDSGMVYLAR